MRKFAFATLILFTASVVLPLEAKVLSTCFKAIKGADIRLAAIPGAKSLVLEEEQILARVGQAWESSTLDSQKIDDLFRNAASLNSALVELTSLIIEERLRHLPEDVARLIRAKVDAIGERSRSDLTSHFDAQSNELEVTWRYPIVTIHEIDHAFFLNTNIQRFKQFKFFQRLLQIFPVGLSWFLLTYFEMEASAIGAQWELVSRIPKRFRKKLIAHLHLGPLQYDSDESFGMKDYSLAEISYLSLINADLSKREFIERMAPHHGYQLRTFIWRYAPTSFAQVGIWASVFAFRSFVNNWVQ